MTAHLLGSLVERVDTLAAPCRSHKEVDAITAAVRDWAFDLGYASSADEWARLNSIRCAEFAAYAFADAPVRKAALFATWILWNTVVDDSLDETGLGSDVEAARAMFDEFDQVLLGGEAKGRHAGALAKLWHATETGTTPAWRARFREDVRLIGATSVAEAVNRDLRRVPTIREYRELRGGTIGRYLFNLIEHMYNVDLPEYLVWSPVWSELAEASNDVVAWCNDLVSYPRENAAGDVHNHVIVAAHELDLDLDAAASWVLDRTVERMADLGAAYRALPEEFDRLGVDLFTSRQASKVACVYAAAPRAHIDWVRCSARYQPS
ncbi:terpene synthase family protein [Actinophytocola oryzae]|uniref:Terpene synthase n=1 Tax=Actinophytocola oryzae TaxID=502181 RepID=A0A4R7W323_9PSEU|nr:terpene synthase family protein [Actinophytocola oryzae]TDV56555.1 hypothetical protein CLV71_102622 [Actinophytocola oryzae]